MTSSPLRENGSSAASQEGDRLKGEGGYWRWCLEERIGVYQVEDEMGGEGETQQRIEQKNTETEVCCSFKKQLSAADAYCIS